MKLKTIILVVNPCVTKGKTFSSFPWFLSQMIKETIALNLWRWKETFHLRFLYSFFPGRKVIKTNEQTCPLLGSNHCPHVVSCSPCWCPPPLHAVSPLGKKGPVLTGKGQCLPSCSARTRWESAIQGTR